MPLSFSIMSIFCIAFSISGVLPTVRYVLAGLLAISQPIPGIMTPADAPICAPFIKAIHLAGWFGSRQSIISLV